MFKAIRGWFAGLFPPRVTERDLVAWYDKRHSGIERGSRSDDELRALIHARNQVAHLGADKN